MRQRVLRIRLNPDEHAVLREMADDSFLPISTYARSLLLRSIREEMLASDRGGATDE